MEMQLIVDRLREDFGNKIMFQYLDAANEGSDLFRELAFRGHPGIIIFLPDGTEAFRAMGQQDEDLLYEKLEEITE